MMMMITISECYNLTILPNSLHYMQSGVSCLAL